MMYALLMKISWSLSLNVCQSIVLHDVYARLKPQQLEYFARQERSTHVPARMNSMVRMRNNKRGLEPAVREVSLFTGDYRPFEL